MKGGSGRVVLVTYNSLATLPRCLASLDVQGGVEFEIVIVDNASQDGTADWVRARRPDLRLVASSENLGFGRANNLALAGEPREWYALVNPDAFLPPRALAACRDALAVRSDVGVVGLRHVDEDGVDQPSAFPFLGLRNLLGEALAVDRWLARAGAWSTRRPAGFDPTRPAEVDWIQGSFLFVRGDLVHEVGGFDPRFFMYGEDMEWCRRVRERGHAILYLPEPVVTHVGGGSAGGAEARLFVEHWKGRRLFFDLHRGAPARIVARVLMALSIGPRWLGYEAAGLAGRAGARRALFRAAMRWLLAGQPPPSARS